MNPSSAAPDKKAYHPPTISVYGNIRALTQAVSATGMLDGGSVATMMHRSAGGT